jgi:hypothetical protein
VRQCLILRDGGVWVMGDDKKTIDNPNPRKGGVASFTKPKGKKPPKPKVKPRKRTHTLGGKGVSAAKGTIIEGNLPSLSLTPELRDRIASHVEKGMLPTLAAQLELVPAKTFSHWLMVGRDQIKEIEAGERKVVPMQAQLVLAIGQAEGKLHEWNLDKIRAGDPKLIFAYDQRRFAREWALPTTAIDQSTGEEKTLDIGALLEAKFKRLVEGG